MNETHEELLNIAVNVLNIQEYLDPRVFAPDGQMHNLLRQRLLHRAQYMIKETIEQIKGLTVEDIVLIGSSASYFYRAGSDLDVVIKVKNQSCPYLTTFTELEDGFCKYLSTLTAYFYSDHKKFFIGKRFLDIKLTHNKKLYIHSSGEYSLIKNKWIRKPVKNIPQDITPESLLNNYYARCREIDDFMTLVPENGDKYSQEQCNKMFYFYRLQALDKNQNIEDFLVFKIIKATGKLKELSAWVFNNQLKTLEF